MEIQFKRSYAPGGAKRYTLGEIPMMLGYAMEIATPRLRMKEGRLQPGQICMLFFGITPEEYALKDGDVKALNALAEKLEKHLPADRLLGWRVVDLKGAAVELRLQPQTGESIDGGAFARRVQEKTAQQRAAHAVIQEAMNADAEGENARLRNLIEREVEFGKKWKELREANGGEEKVRGALEGMLTLRNFAWRELGNASLYALCAGGAREKCVLLGVPNRPEKRLAAFTDCGRAQAFAGRIKEKPLPVKMDFDELARRSALCDGMVIDAGVIGYLLRRTDYDRVRELRGKPPVAVRVQKAETAAPRSAQELGGLPDPDAFLPRTEAEKTETDAPAAQDQPKGAAEAPRRGLFQKLFGKSR